MAREFKTGYKVTGDASGGIRAAQATRAELDKVNKSIEEQGKKSRETTADFSKLTAKIGAAAAIAGTALIYGFSKTAIETEKLRGSLVTMVGDMDRAGIAFDALSAFAAKTPFTLDQSVQAFIKMKALGLEPTEEALTSFGNTASAMGKDLSQMIEAVADASTMEFERLKEFGIKARQEGDNVSFTFQGVTTTVKKNSTEIVEYLKSIGNTKFAGAMEDQMQRLPGLISNLEDNVSGLFRAMGDAGGITIMGNAISWLSGQLADLTEQITSGALIDDMSLRWEQFAGTFSSSWNSMTTSMAVDFQGLFLSMGHTVDEFMLSQSGTGESFMTRWLDALALLPVLFQEIFGAIITIVGNGIANMGAQIDIWIAYVKIGMEEAANSVASVWDAIKAGWSGIAAGQSARQAAHEQSIENLNTEIARLEEHQRILAQDAMASLKTAADNVLAAKQKMQADREAAKAQRELEAEAKKSKLTLDDLAKSAAGAGGEMTGMGKEAKAAAKELEALNDRLDPLAKLQRQFTVDQAILAGKIAEGGDGVVYYTQLLETLKEEYAEAARESVGFGEKAAAAAEKAAERAAKAAQKEADARAKALAKQADDVETFQKAFERGIERMDDLGADLWKGWFTGAKSAMDSIKSFFQNWLAEMAHAAITRPILVSITAAMGLGGASAAVAGVPGAVGGLGGAASGISGLSGLGSIASLFTGSSIGMGLQNLPTWLGGVSNGISSTGGFSLFGNAAAYSNWQYGLTGILGGLLGQKIFGGQGGLGGGIGSALGLAAFGPLGAILGGLGGGFLGGLFGKERPAVLQASGFDTSGLSRSDNDARFSSMLGGGFLRSRRIEDVAPFLSGLQQFDDQIAQYLDADTLGRATAALKSWNLQLEGEAITMEGLLESRFKVILSTLSDDMRTFVQEVSGLEGQVERLALGSMAQKIIDAAPDLFEGRTFREFITVAEAMQQAGEDLGTTFQRLAEQVVTIANQLTLVRGFADSNLVDDYNALIAGQGQTLKDVTDGLAAGIRGLRGEFTGSADDLTRLAGLVSQRYQSEIAYLQQIDQVIAGITGGFQGLKEQINRDLFGDAAFYDQITDQAEQLALDLKSMTDPAKIAATVAEIQRLTGIAYGMLDEPGKAASGQGFLDFIEGVESDAGEALQLARDLFVEESQVLRQLVEDMADEFADPLAIAATAHEDAAAALFQAGQTLNSAAADMGSVAGQLIGAVREGLSNIGQALTPPVGGAALNTISSGGGGTSTQQSTTQQLVNVIASRLERVESAVLNAGGATVNAITQTGGPQIIVEPPRSRGSVLL